MNYAPCPRCQLDIADERRNQSPVVCNHCGFTSPKKNNQVQSEVESRFIKISLGLSLFFVAAFIQVVNWDNHALTVLPLQAKSLFGVMSAQDQEEMATLCMDRQKYDCVERMYSKTAATSLDNRARFADFLSKREKVRPAAEQYKLYFDEGGVDLQARYNYAKLLAQLGEFDQAAVLFHQVIDAKPDTVQITVVQHYVRALIHANQLDKAKKMIEEVRKQSAQANSFMAEEMAQITGHS
jgi:tetratricopeptide (TPR) repeat protein